MNYRFLKSVTVAALLSSSLSACTYYHAWNGIGYMIDEDKALTQETQKYLQGEWKKQPASATERAEVEEKIRSGYLNDFAKFMGKFGASDKIRNAIVDGKEQVNIQFGKTYRYAQGSSRYFCSSFLVLDQDGKNSAKNVVTPIFVESDRDPGMSNTNANLIKQLCR